MRSKSRDAFPRRQHGLYDAMHEPEQLQAEFMRLAGVLRACGERFFEDDPYLWDDLEAKRARRADDDEVRRTLALSQERFRAREWHQVIDLLAPIQHRLGSTATARLAYARAKGQTGRLKAAAIEAQFRLRPMPGSPGGQRCATSPSSTRCSRSRRGR